MITSIAFSSDGKHLAAGVDQTVVLWDVQARAPLHKVPFDDPITAVSFSDCGTILATAARKTITLLRSKTVEFITSVELESHVTSIDFYRTSDSTRPGYPDLVAGCENGTILLFDAANSVKERCRSRVHTDSVNWVGFLRRTDYHGTELVSAGDDRQLVQLECDGPSFITHARRKVATGFVGKGRNASFIFAEPNGTLEYIAGLHSRRLGSWHLYLGARPAWLQAGRISLGILPDSINITALCTYFNSYRDSFVLGYEDGVITWGKITLKQPWKPILRRVKAELHSFASVSAHQDSVTALAEKSGILASGSTDGKVKLWNLTNPPELAPIGELNL